MRMQTTCAELLIVEGGRKRRGVGCCGVDERLGEGPFEGRSEDRKGVGRQTIGYF